MAQTDETGREIDEVDEDRADATEAILAAAILAILLNADPTSPSPPSILGVPDWNGAISTNLRGALTDYLTSVAMAQMQAMGVDRFQAAEAAPRIVRQVLPETIEALAGGTAHLYEVGSSISKGQQGLTVASRPSDTASGRSSDTYRRIRIGSAALARNRTTAMREALRHQLALAAGATHATWRTRKDNRVRPTHGGLEGDTNPIEVPWTTFEGHPLRYPGDPLAPLDETMGCRCRLAYRLPEGVVPNAGDLVGGPQPAPQPSHLDTEYEGAAR